MSKKSEDVELWHKKLGHTNYWNIQQLMSKEAERRLPVLEIKDRVCGECQVGKRTKGCHQKLQQVERNRGKKYVYKENEQHVIRIRSDHEKEFENSKFSEFCANDGITHQFSSPITPQHNGVFKGRIILFRRWLVLCYMQKLFLSNFGLKQ
ncbi:hypothetical protein LIER_35851 [Lithospermum erythrorhizon]|uniref:GAG-pre-integrase domain-containing protein n=1 Tax=Lithospermum erythrorhizon TaxID=34254 RepID=A0AAV3NX68_LITER